MKIVTFTELSEQNFNVKYLNSLKQFWRDTKEFKCIGEPKKQDLLFMLNGCSVRYTDLNKRRIVAHSGDVVYVPTRSEYVVEFFNFDRADSHTVGINFKLIDENGEKVSLSDGIVVFQAVGEDVAKLFEMSSTATELMPYVRRRMLLLEILCAVFQSTDEIKDNRSKKLILEGLKHICQYPESMISVSELARMCNISEVYFRRLFKENIGMSPVEYRNRLRLEKAKQYLEYGDISIQEISDMLGYSTVSHFIKRFRERYGYPPLEYRKRRRTEGSKI